MSNDNLEIFNTWIGGALAVEDKKVTSELDKKALANMIELEKKAKKLNLMELTERTCKWPIGDPATDKFWFCGHQAENGKPYCSTHVAIELQPVSARRERRPR